MRSAASGFDDGFHVVEIAMQRLAPTGGELVRRFRATIFERLRAVDVARILELARVGAQIAVTHIKERFQIAERQLVIDGERAHDPEAYSLVDESPEFRVLVARCRGDASRSGFRR